MYLIASTDYLIWFLVIFIALWMATLANFFVSALITHLWLSHFLTFPLLPSLPLPQIPNQTVIIFVQILSDYHNSLLLSTGMRYLSVMTLTHYVLFLYYAL